LNGKLIRVTPRSHLEKDDFIFSCTEKNSIKIYYLRLSNNISLERVEKLQNNTFLSAKDHEFQKIKALNKVYSRQIEVYLFLYYGHLKFIY
jgi:hypothetical protein